MDINFHYPMAVSALGTSACAIFSLVYCKMAGLEDPPSVDNALYYSKIVPVGVMQGLTLFLGNLVYLHLTVAFIEVARSSMPLLTLLGLWMTKLEIPNRYMVLAVTLTTIGCAIAATGEVGLNPIGVICMTANLLMETVRMILTQFLLVGCSLHPIQSLKYITPWATFSLLVGSFVMEREVWTWETLEAVQKGTHYFVFAAMFGLGVNLISMLIIKLSSATTMKVLAAVRGPLIVLSGILLFSETVTTVEMVGYCGALLGSIWYVFTSFKQQWVEK